MNPGNFKTNQLVFKPIKTGKDDTCRFMPIKINCNDSEKDLLFVTEKLFSFGAQKPAKYKSYSLPLCLWDETKDTISKKRELLQAFQAIEKECKKYLKRRKLNTPWKIKVYYHVYLIQIKNQHLFYMPLLIKIEKESY